MISGPKTMNVGDILTFDGCYEREGLWRWLMRRMGRYSEPRKLRTFVVTKTTRDVAMYEPLRKP